MKNFVVAIARGYGSGGKQIGIKLAEELGIRLIDRELIQMASIQSGISEELFNLNDERLKKKFFRADDKGYIGNILTPVNEKFVSDINLFNIQAKILKIMAVSESFVVIGKAADHVLRDFPNVLSVNIQAPFEDCVRAIMKRAQIDRKAAEKDVRKTDRYRADYYKFYTGKNWYDAINFDLCLNSSSLGRENCVEIIKECLRKKLGVQI